MVGGTGGSSARVSDVQVKRHWRQAASATQAHQCAINDYYISRPVRGVRALGHYFARQSTNGLSRVASLNPGLGPLILTSDRDALCPDHSTGIGDRRNGSAAWIDRCHGTHSGPEN